MKIERPECAGWHEPDPTCDGGGGEAPCSYRGRCLALIVHAGGKGRRTKASIDRVLEEWDDEKLGAWLAERETSTEARLVKAAETPPPVAPPPSRPSTRGGGPILGPDPLPGFGDAVRKQRAAHDIFPRPEERFGHVLPIVDALLDRLARELGRRVVLEGDRTMKIGDLYLRFVPGMGGRTVSLYEAIGRKTNRHRLIARAVMLRRTSALNLKVNTRDFSKCIALEPPSAVTCRTWRDVKPCVALVGVDAHSVRESAQWLARVYNENLIEGRT